MHFLNSTEILLCPRAGHPIATYMAEEKWHLKPSPFCPWQKWWGYRRHISAGSAPALKFKGFRMTGKRFPKDQDVKIHPLLFLFCLYCSFDCFCQPIVCLPLGLIHLPSWIPLYFSLLKRVFYTRGNISSEKFC